MRTLGARPNPTHASGQNIEDLWEFIQTPTSNPFSKGKEIIRSFTHARRIMIGVRFQGAEFEHGVNFAPLTYTILGVENFSSRGDQQQQGGYPHQWEQDWH